MKGKKISNGIKVKILVIFAFIAIMFLQVGPYLLYADENAKTFSYRNIRRVATNEYYNSSALSFAEATLDGEMAYCLDYGKPLPVESGGTVYKIDRVLNNMTTAVLRYGYPNYSAEQLGLGRYSAEDANEYAKLATQFAVWRIAKASGDSQKTDRVFDMENLKPVSGYETVLKDIESAANTIIAKAEANPYLPDPVLNIDNAGATAVVNNGKVITGPYKLTVTGFDISSISVTLKSGPSGAYLSDVSGNAKTQFSNGDMIYVTSNVSNIESKVQISARSTGSYMLGKVYGTGKSDDGKQDYCLLTTQPVDKTVEASLIIPAIKGSIRVFKHDQEGAPLQGVTFDLKDSSGKVLDTKKTDSNGIIKFENLPIGEYIVQETSSLEGYIKCDVPLKVTVKYNNETNVDVENKKITDVGGIMIEKYCEDKKTPVPNVTFNIYDDDGKQVDTIVTNSEGRALTKALPVGTYFYQEQLNCGEPDYIVIDTTMKEIEIEEANKIYKKKVWNYNKKGSITIHKVDTEGNNVSGIEFTLLDGNRKYVDKKVTDANGIAKFENLSVGKYTFLESKGVPAYVNENYTKDVELTLNNLNVTSEVVNKFAKGKLKIIKTGDDTKPIKGVQFSIYSAEEINPLMSEPVDKITTDENGIAISKDLKVGSYYYHEEKVPDNVIRDDQYYSFRITKNNEVIEKEIENELLKYGKIQIVKKDDGNNLLKGIKFQILNENKEVVDEVTTDENGTASSKELLLGKYYVKEVENEATKPYIVDKKDMEVNLTEKGQVINIEKNNERKRGSINIFKVDEDGNYLKDIIFTLMDANGKEIDSKATDETGHAKFENLLPGKYSFKEVNVPEQYVDTKEVKTVEITIDQLNVETEVKNIFATGKLRIVKSDRFETKLKGVKFNITDKDGNIVDTITTDENGVAVSKRLRLGTYFYQEDATSVPKGIIADTRKYEFKLTENDYVVEKKVVNENEKGSLSIFKVDEDGNYLENVTFTLLDSDGKEVDKKTTGKDGLAKFTDLDVGEYNFKEVDAPVNVVKNEEPQAIEITIDKLNVEVTVKNDFARGNLRIHKTDMAGNELEGVVFEILDSNKKVIETLTTDDNGMTQSSDLKLGEYYYREVSATDPNVIVDKKEKDFKLTQNDQIILKDIENATVTGTIIIKKVDSKNSNIALKDAEIEVLDANKNVISKITTDENGMAKLGNLKVGKYYYREVKAPNGYVLNSAEHEFNISQTSEVVNEILKNEAKRLPQTGGFLSTNMLIVIIVSVVSIIGYAVITIIRNKKDK